MRLLLAFFFVVPISAIASPGDFCAKMPCGTYDGLRDGETGVTTTIEITGKSTHHGRFLYTINRANEKPSVWDLNVRFRNAGQFELTRKDGTPYASGICEDRICTYGMHPFPNKDGKTWGNTGLLQFKDDGLDLLMVVGFPTDNKSFLTQLSKK